LDGKKEEKKKKEKEKACEFTRLMTTVWLMTVVTSLTNSHAFSFSFFFFSSFPVQRKSISRLLRLLLFLLCFNISLFFCGGVTTGEIDKSRSPCFV
jgi:threonine/homoserine/homoserine lactone efflux protein